MKPTHFALFALCLALGCATPQKKALTNYVNPFIGTGGHGHTYPGATLPFGMVQLSPDTRLEGWDGCSGYHYTDSVVYGFSHTHLSGTGVSDYGDVLLMPIQGDIAFDNGAGENQAHNYSSPFQKSNESASPGYYEVKLDKHNIRARLTANTRVGIHEYTFKKSNESHVVLDLAHRDQLLADSIVVVNDKEVVGKRISKAWAEEQHIYFALEFSQPFKKHTPDSTGHKMAFSFDMEAGGKLSVKVGISAVDIEGARENLKAEAPHWDFERYRQAADSIWAEALSKIEVLDSDEDKKTIFYSALYHSLLAPNTFSDVDGRYRGMDKRIHQSDHTVYTVFSLWDTFRATHPLYTIIEQKRTNEFIKTFLKQYQEGGILPIWELAGNYTGCMIGYHAIPVIADAYAKGIRDYDNNLAINAMQFSAKQDKLGLEAYKSKGCINMGDEAESVSKTLEYAYDDWCIAEMARLMGKEDIFDEFIKRGQYYKNVFNPEVGFMQSKMNGAWSHGFDPAEVNYNFTEANSWQYSMFVPQDVSGMVQLYGGAEAFEAKLDELFTTEMVLSGRDQVDITGLIGQYAHGNEPSHHMAYLYNYIGKAHKTQERAHQILNEQYSTLPEGLSGNEDCGQMSSWYVLSSMGFYSVTPGLDEYAIGSPQFEEVKIKLENGNVFTIKTKNKGKYIQSATLNGKLFNQSFLKHGDIMKGGELVFEMSKKPNKNWAKERSPVAAIDEAYGIVPVPYFKTEALTFTDSLLIEIKTIQAGDSIFYSLNGGEFQAYQQRFHITADAEIHAYSQRDGKRSFVVDDARYKKIRGGRSIKIQAEYANQYSAGGNDALINYLKGGRDYRTGYWQGYFGQDFSAVVELADDEVVSQLSLGALQDIRSWIWYPKSVTFSISNNGKDFKKLKTIKNEFSDKEYGGFNQEFRYQFPRPTKVKYVKVEAENYGTCPKWHLGDGNPTWLFFDEILVE